MLHFSKLIKILFEFNFYLLKVDGKDTNKKDDNDDDKN